MASNFHESFAAGDVKPPSERATGLVFAAVALVVAFSWRRTEALMWWALAIAAALALVSLMAPRLLKPLNILWFKFGLLLHRIVNPLVMFALFALVFVPAGAIMRLVARSVAVAAQARGVDLLDRPQGKRRRGQGR